MHNTFFIFVIAFFLTVPAYGQFYTIAREPKAKSRMQSVQMQNVENQALNSDILEVKDSVGPIPIDTLRERADFALVRKRNVKKRVNTMRKRPLRSENRNAKAKDISFLPKLTIPNLIREIRYNNIKHEEIVLAQAILETGWFTSSVCKNKNNLFGLTNPRTGQYYEFNHWTESVEAYYSKVQYRYKGGNYLRWLDKIGYAEADNYVTSLISIIRQLRK